MPLLAKGGKYVFGWSRVRDDLSIQLPPMATREYSITVEGKVFLISGSKKTGGFVVTRKGLLYSSKIGNILRETPLLCAYKTEEGEFVAYKGRLYCWCNITASGVLKFSEKMLDVLKIEAGSKLLAIRGSDIAFSMGARGELLERAENYRGEVEVF